MRLDLHMHTHLSDGQCSPQRLAEMVGQQRLKAWSVTDHDTCAAYDELDADETLICGVEITSDFEGHEIHVLGLGVDRHHTDLSTLLNEIAVIRRQRAEALLAVINKQFQVSLSCEDVVPADARVITRLHLAQGLRAQGLIQHHRDFFNELFPESRMRQLDLVPYPAVAHVAQQIRAAGGAAILAHPCRYGGFDLIERLVQQGLDGLEISYPHVDATVQAQLRRLADKHDLLRSCGSDFHWPGRRQPGACRLSHAEARPLLSRLGWKDPLR